MIKKISQIYISRNNSDLLPPELVWCVASVKSQFPEHEHRIYNDNDLKDFLASNFELEVLNAYNKLVPYAYKADLGRYCLLYILGGWYFDVGTYGNRFTPQVNFDALFFRDLHSMYHAGAVLTGVMYSEPKNPVFMDCIRTIVQNCDSNFYGLTPWCPTGSVVLCKALYNYWPDKGTIYGEHKVLTPGYKIQNRAYIFPNGEILAWRKDRPAGDLVPPAAGVTNNYLELHRARKVYGE